MHQFLDDGLDELAARAYQGRILRTVTTVAVAALATTLLPPETCGLWVALALASEFLGQWATRRQSQGETAGLGLRLAHLTTLAAGSLIWMSLGGLFWLGGQPAGAVCAVLLWLSVIFFAQTYAYQSRAGFIVSGVAPGAGLMLFVILGPNPLDLPLLPVAGMLTLALAFAADGVLKALDARRELDDAQKRLRTSESQYRVLADNLTDVIALNDVDGRRRYVSPSIEAAMGYSVAELFSTDNYTFLHPEDASWVPGEISNLVATGGELTLQYRVIHKSGTIIWVETNFGLIADPEPGAPPQIISVSRQIDARKAMETELVEARRRAEQAAAAKSEFLANMTHELRTPLNAIVGFSGIMRRSARLEDQDARHLSLIHDASTTLLELVNSVLDFSRLEAGAVEIEVRAFDPQAAVEAVAALMHEQAQDKGLDLKVVTRGQVTPLLGDVSRIRQVLLNFLSNAVKFTSRGGVTVTVCQSERENDDALLRLEVTDTGIGLAQDQISQLFERFTQADASVSRQYGGTGLGLAICKRTVELMGGTLGATSEAGRGSTFWFELVLPQTDSLTADDTQAAETLDLESPLRLLVVEDVAVNRELITALLSPFDVTIETAENGAEAVAAVRSRAFDLVLMDVQMPVMDGLSATRAIRALADPHLRGLPIIAMTANVLPEQVQKCLDAGMDDHLGKPVSPARLLEVLTEWPDLTRAAEPDRAVA